MSGGQGPYKDCRATDDDDDGDDGDDDAFNFLVVYVTAVNTEVL
jgi:hypothetical protein